MSFTDWFRRKTPLQIALRNGFARGEVQTAIRNLGDIKISSKSDADAICDSLSQILESNLPGETYSDAFRGVVGLFQQIDGAKCPAFPILRSRGNDLLVDVIENALSSGDEKKQSEVLFGLKILAMYATRKGADLIIRLAWESFSSNGWLWSMVLGGFHAEHPEARRVFISLSDPLPSGSIAVALLDGANRFCLEHGEIRHPFDSDAGLACLRNWLADPEEDQFSYAISATAALPFLTHSAFDEILSMAIRHPSADVRCEAAWAAAKLGRESGYEALRKMCLELNISSRARTYLEELKRPDMIPAEASSPAFTAKAEFVDWLAHPSELGRTPDEVEIVDHRTLKWPPDFAERAVWLLRYKAKDRTGFKPDDVGIGMVGSVTFCFFSYDLPQRPPEDCYAIHCVWELEDKLIEIHDVRASNQDYLGMLSQWKGEARPHPGIEHVAELDLVVGQHQKLVGIARADLAEKSGWIVLDGDASTWYPAEDFPPDENAKTVLNIHIGLGLLDLKATNRREWLRPKETIPDDQIIVAYEKLLSELLAGSRIEKAFSKSRRERLLSNFFEAYVAASASARHADAEMVCAETYEKFLVLARREAATSAVKAFDIGSPVADHFTRYVRALVALGRQQDVLDLLPTFAPHWEHNLGYGMLGEAAYLAGNDSTAEHFLLKQKAGQENWPESESIAYLSEIWLRRGEEHAALQLNLESLRKILASSANETGTGIDFYEKIYQRHAKNFSRLFGPRETLLKHGLPETTIR